MCPVGIACRNNIRSASPVSIRGKRFAPAVPISSDHDMASGRRAQPLQGESGDLGSERGSPRKNMERSSVWTDAQSRMLETPNY